MGVKVCRWVRHLILLSHSVGLRRLGQQLKGAAAQPSEAWTSRSLLDALGPETRSFLTCITVSEARRKC